MSEKEIRELSVGKLNMLLQRANEPVYKGEIDRKLQEQGSGRR